MFKTGINAVTFLPVF